MPISTITAKGQTTIPKPVRDSVHLKPHDKLFYMVEGDSIIIRPVRGSVRDLKGIFKEAVKGPIDFKKLREDTKRAVAKRMLGKLP